MLRELYIDRDDVCHCEEGRKPCPHFGGELRMQDLIFL